MNRDAALTCILLLIIYAETAVILMGRESVEELLWFFGVSSFAFLVALLIKALKPFKS